MHVWQTAPAKFWHVGREMHVKEEDEEKIRSFLPPRREEKRVSLPSQQATTAPRLPCLACLPVQN